MSETFTDLAADLARSSRSDSMRARTWPRWASEREYSESQIATLMRAVARLTRHPSDLEAVSSDLSERVDVDGKAIERVRPEDRLADRNAHAAEDVQIGGQCASTRACTGGASPS
jgi:hypothetical protein